MTHAQVDVIIASVVVLLFLVILWRSPLVRAILIETFTHPMRKATIKIREKGVFVQVENSEILP